MGGMRSAQCPPASAWGSTASPDSSRGGFINASLVCSGSAASTVNRAFSSIRSVFWISTLLSTSSGSCLLDGLTTLGFDVSDNEQRLSSVALVFNCAARTPKPPVVSAGSINIVLLLLYYILLYNVFARISNTERLHGVGHEIMKIITCS